MYYFENETSFYLFIIIFLILKEKKLGLFEKVTKKFNGPSSKIFVLKKKQKSWKKKKNWVFLKKSLGSSMALV